MNQIKIVFSDIDGTLLDSSHMVSNQTKLLIDSFLKDSGHFVLASARPPQAMKKISEELGTNLPLICFNGALIGSYDNKQRFSKMYELPLERMDTLLIYQMLASKFPGLSISVYSDEHWYVEKNDEWSIQEAEIINIQPQIISFPKFLKEYNPVHKILCMADASLLDDVEQNLLELNFLDVDFYRSKENYLEIVNQKVSKLSAILFLCDLYGIELSETLGIGDNYNDLSMIVNTGIGVAMGNAPKDVQSKADYITDTNDNDGLALALKKFLSLDII